MNERSFQESVTDKNEFDVVIAGCGFTGLYLAQLLSQKYRVCVIEKNDQIFGPLNTTGSTMYNGVDDIFTLFGIPKNLIINSYNSIEIISKENKATTPPNSFPWVLLDIPKLKNEIYRRFAPSVITLCGHEVVGLIKGNDRYEGVEVHDINSNNYKNIMGKIVVDCTGSKVSLASKAGLQTPQHLAKCFQVDADIPEPIHDSQIRIYVGFDFCPAGYAYIFPISKNRIRIGTCGTPDLSKTAFTAEELFKKFIVHTGLELTNISNQLNLNVFTGGITKKNSHLNLIALGDAAGNISPIIGEGIRFAFHSAEIASKLIEESLIKNDSRNLEKFYSLWKKRFGLKFSIAYLIQFVFTRASNQKINTLVGKIKVISLNDPSYIFRIFATKFRIYDILKIFI